MTKMCSKCKEVKEANEFYSDQRSASGLSSYCKACKKIIRKERYKRNPETGAVWDKKHPDRARARVKRYRDSISDTVKEILEEITDDKMKEEYGDEQDC